MRHDALDRADVQLPPAGDRVLPLGGFRLLEDAEAHPAVEFVPGPVREESPAHLTPDEVEIADEVHDLVADRLVVIPVRVVDRPVVADHEHVARR